MRQDRSKPLWEELHLWLQLERTRVPEGSAVPKAIHYSLNRWSGFGRFLVDGDVPLDNKHCENQMRLWALGRKNWLYIENQLAGERAAVVMSLLQSAKLHGHGPRAYLKDVLTWMPTQLNSRLDELLPHRWQRTALRRRPCLPEQGRTDNSRTTLDSRDRGNGAEPSHSYRDDLSRNRPQDRQHGRDAYASRQSPQDAAASRLRLMAQEVNQGAPLRAMEHVEICFAHPYFRASWRTGGRLP